MNNDDMFPCSPYIPISLGRAEVQTLGVRGGERFSSSFTADFTERRA